MAYGKLCRRMDGKKSIIRISKKMLNRIRYVWTTEQPYKISVVE